MTVKPPEYKVTQDAPSTLSIEWIVSNVCNYSCSYCIPELYDGSSRWPDVNNALNFFWAVENKYPGQPKCLIMTGGEPTLWPALFSFVKQLPNSYILDISTNGSRSLRFWQDFKQYGKFRKINISAHLADCDIEHLIGVCKILQHDVITTVLALMLPGYEEKYNRLFQRIEEEKLNITAFGKGIRNFEANGELIEYTPEQNELVKRNYRNRTGFKFPPIALHTVVDDQKLDMEATQEFILNQYNKFKGWKCKIGIERIVIDQWGNITGAMCSTARSQPIGVLGEDFTLPTEPTVCQDTICPCLLDMRITKWKENGE